VRPRPVARGAAYAFIWLLLTLNALPTFIGEAVRAHGWIVAAFNLFDVSAIVWMALAAGLALAWREDRALDASDKSLIAAAVLVALVPVPSLSAAFLTIISACAVARAAKGTALFRAAAVFLGLSTFLFWGRLLLALGAGPLLGADAQFVGLISGMPVRGNMVGFADGTHFLIAPGCSSLHGVSLALILWTTALAWFDLRPTRALWLTLAAAVIASVAVNGVRLTAIAWSPASFDYWHNGGGAMLFGWIALLAIGGVVFLGLRSALDAR
jgi:exosortase/archaeosortase family protein